LLLYTHARSSRLVRIYLRATDHHCLAAASCLFGVA
jgi:hypothetical protein